MEQENENSKRISYTFRKIKADDEKQRLKQQQKKK